MMRRRAKKSESAPGMSWLVTFTDLMTLLLSFFVLLLSMSSMDRSVLREMASHFVGELGLAPKKGAGKVPARFEIVKKAVENPIEVLQDPKRIRDTLFPDEVLPKNLSKSTLEKNLQVLLRPEGVALVLSDALLFSSGESVLNEDSRRLLSELVVFLAGVPAPVNIAGYTDSTPSSAPDNYALSSERAMAVLTFFLEFGFAPARFSVSAYGDAFPLADNETPEGRAQNRRVEILLKTSTRSYL